ncbi:MAG: tRNA preQ1(34) S-adenosylmethionine ribosyltransferase-isomerase QueA [Gemmatimonadetes bacterium]|nr:tRNA preQ1(34) S-adenosylmethionine ribosyltransferase-isomerase QueA [Gemmatimonadota bacterium]
MTNQVSGERLDDYDFDLPADRIAQHPPPTRDAARLLILNRVPGHITLAGIPGLLEVLRRGDLIVRNTTRVFPARLLGERSDTGGRVEALLVSPLTEDRWIALLKPARRLRAGVPLEFGGSLRAAVEEVRSNGRRVLRFDLAGEALDEAVDACGRIPLPPYIRRQPQEEDRERYQTVYANVRGSVAAPTAGLHLTGSLIEGLLERGVEVADLVLHVGPGTFRPVGEGGIAQHKMHAEAFDLPQDTARAIRNARARGGRVVAIGTTVARVLEARAAPGRLVSPGRGTTDIFIHPPMQLRIVDALLTNFHLPRSTLLMLVSAMAGREAVLAAYEKAISAGFRFYSYGDAMFICSDS